MVLTDPRLVEVERIEVLDQLHVALKRQCGVLADPMEGCEEDAKRHSRRLVDHVLLLNRWLADGTSYA